MPFPPPVTQNQNLGDMATLRNQRGEPLLDGDGQEIKEGSVVVDDMFGEGIAAPFLSSMVMASTCSSISLARRKIQSHRQVAASRT